MIDYQYLGNFQLDQEFKYDQWFRRISQTLGVEFDEITYIFCDDEYLYGLNQEFLRHDTYTDVITFDYGTMENLSGDIFISTDRVVENASSFKVVFDEELRRVMAHGVLHLMGFNDKLESEIIEMRNMEQRLLDLFHVEQNDDTCF